MNKFTRIVKCGCGAESGPRRWMSQGWLRVQVFYDGGGKRTIYTCDKCREKNIAAHEAAKALKNGQPTEEVTP